MDNEIKTAAEVTEADVLPRCREVHCDPDQEATEVPEDVAQSSLAGKSPAQWAYERLILYIQNFEKTLDNEHEVAMGFTGDNVGVIRIEGMGYFDPDIVTFYGSDMTGAKTQLVQHITQLSVLLRAAPKQVDAAAPNRIGFRLAQGIEKA